MEKRHQNNDLELRAADDGSRTIQGYAVKWGMLSHEIGSSRRFREQFHKGAFEESLSNEDQRALWSHDTGKVLGRTKNNTLRLWEDDIGLRFELDLPNTTLGNDTWESVQRGDVDGVSFGFRKAAEKWEQRTDGVIRNVHKASIHEISVVAFPAYPDSDVAIRSCEDFFNSQEKRQRLILKTLL